MNAVASYERKHEPGYHETAWERGRCFPTLEALEAAWKLSFMHAKQKRKLS
jgi:hypothetical protein